MIIKESGYAKSSFFNEAKERYYWFNVQDIQIRISSFHKDKSISYYKTGFEFYAPVWLSEI